MIAHVDNNRIPALREVALHPNHPFQPLVSYAFEAINTAWKRHNIGVVIASGETGVAAAAIDIAQRSYIPVTGFAQRGKENEAGNMKEHYQALLLEPSNSFFMVNHDRADAEMRNYAPYARHNLRREADELNARYSDAVVIMLASDSDIREWVDGGRLQALKNTSPTLVCDLADDCTTQAAKLEEFLATHKPWFLNIAGARESLSEVSRYSVYERAAGILSAALR